MSLVSKNFALLAAVALGGVVASHAHAALVASGSVGGAPTGVFKENFDTLLPGNTSAALLPSGVTISFSPDGQPVTGAASGVYAAPFLSGGNGSGFGAGGSNQPNGADTTPYLTTGSTGSSAGASVTLQLPGLERYFGLLWGSIDNYNTLSFYKGATLVGSFTGSDITASPSGDQGVNGTLYVNVDATAGSTFDRVVATSSQYAFEFDNVAFDPCPAPEPLNLGVFGTGLLGLVVARRRGTAV
jgi:hypothetical protein